MPFLYIFLFFSPIHASDKDERQDDLTSRSFSFSLFLPALNSIHWLLYRYTCSAVSVSTSLSHSLSLTVPLYICIRIGTAHICESSGLCACVCCVYWALRRNPQPAARACTVHVIEHSTYILAQCLYDYIGITRLSERAPLLAESLRGSGNSFLFSENFSNIIYNTSRAAFKRTMATFFFFGPCNSSAYTYISTYTCKRLTHEKGNFPFKPR